jgi:hypothetical protein
MMLTEAPPPDVGCVMSAWIRVEDVGGRVDGRARGGAEPQDLREACVELLDVLPSRCPAGITFTIFRRPSGVDGVVNACVTSG